MGTQIRTMPRFRSAAFRLRRGPDPRLSPPTIHRALPGLVRLLLALALALPAGLLSQGARPALATAGDLDPTFGTGGIVLTGFGVNDIGRAIAMQGDGKVVVAGSTAMRGDLAGDFALARYLPNGALDSTFGSGGRVTTDFGGDDRATALVIQPDGNLVAGGRSAGLGGAFALARYLPNGSLDTSFGVGGRVLTTLGAEAYALALQADGKLVASGTRLYEPDGSLDPDIALARYNPDGRLDSSFGDGGKVTADLGLVDVAFAVAVQTDGKVVIAGVRGESPLQAIPPEGPADFVLARYESAGGASVTTGGRGLGITPRVGIDLTWTEGNQQLGYLVVRDPDSSASLPAGSAAFTDVAPAWPPTLNCYVLVPLGPAGPLGVSDALCARQGLASPAVAGAPQNFTLRLNESATASLSWSGLRGHLGSLLLAVPFDGRPPRVTWLPVSASSATDATGGAFTCYQLHAVYSTGSAQTDLVCGLPGVAQFPATAAEAGPAQGRARGGTGSSTSKGGREESRPPGGGGAGTGRAGSRKATAKRTVGGRACNEAAITPAASLPSP